MATVMKALPNSVALLFAYLICTPVCLAQADPWEHVRIIQPGRNVYVKLHTNKSLKGKMDAWRSDGLTILRDGSHVVSIQKSDVAQVALLIGKSRRRKALYAGLIAGAAVGTLTGIAYKSSDCCEVPTAAVVAGSGAFYGGLAAGIAALFAQHHEVVYSAAKPLDSIILLDRRSL